jgi:hypothetical protein
MFTIHSKVPYDPHLLELPGELDERLRQYLLRLVDVLREHATAINGDDVWEDLTFPAEGINPAGAPDAASYDTTTYPGTLLFSGTQDRHVAGTAQMPHAWREGTTIKPHIHWTKTTADAGGAAVTWQMRFATASIDGAVSAYSGWTAGTLVQGNLTSLEWHNITSFGDLAMTGLGVSTIVIWELRRVGSTDAYNSNARLLALDFHYQRNSSGSRREYVK